MFSKHDELDKEMDFQMHLHEPRRIRIETDIHNVRAGSFQQINECELSYSVKRTNFMERFTF